MRRFLCLTLALALITRGGLFAQDADSLAIDTPQSEAVAPDGETESTSGETANALSEDTAAATSTADPASKTIDAKLLLAWSIYNANDEELSHLSKLTGIEGSGESLKEKLFQHFEIPYAISTISSDFKQNGAKDEGSTFEIVNADVVEKSDDNSSISISGNVQVRLSSSSGTQLLRASTIEIDRDNKYLVAYGGVTITDEALNKAMKDVSAQAVFLDWNNGNIHLVETVGEVSNNSGSSPVNYYLGGSDMVFNGDTGDLMLRDGSVSTASGGNRNDALWQIATSHIITRGTGDVFFNWLTLKMGRVPVIPPLPGFFLPGKALVFNPSIGFKSDKGAFVNASFYVYGNPSSGDMASAAMSSSSEGKLSANSFSNLFASGGSEGAQKDGIFYKKGKAKQSKVEEWAKATSSYLSILGDVSEDYGPFVGLDTKNSWTRVQSSLNFTGGVAYNPKGETNPKYSSYVPKLRYVGNFDSSISAAGFNFKLALPFQSDPKARYQYLNRLSGITLDALFFSNVAFPTTYSNSDVTSENFTLNTSWTLPSRYSSKLLSNFSISASAGADLEWTPPVEDSGKYSYKFKKASLADASASLGGTFFKIDIKPKKKKVSKDEEKKSIVRGSLTSLEEALIDERERRHLVPPEKPPKFASSPTVRSDEEAEGLIAKGELVIAEPLEPLPTDSGPTKSETLNLKTASLSESENTSINSNSSIFTLGLTYSFTETFRNTYQKQSIATDTRLLGDRSTYSMSAGNIELSGGVLPEKALRFSQTLVPTYTWEFNELDGSSQTEKMLLTGTTKAEIPLLGITYNLTANYWTIEKALKKGEVVTDTNKRAKFTKDFVTSHSLMISKSFYGVSVALNAMLPPLGSVSLDPSLSYKLGNFMVSAKHTMEGANFFELKEKRSTFSGAYNHKNLSVALNANYDWEKRDQSSRLFGPINLSEQFELKFLSDNLRLSQSLMYYGFKDNYNNYFESITAGINLYNGIFTTNLNFRGEADKIKLDVTKLTLSTMKHYLPMWKNRIDIWGELSTTMNLNFESAYQNSLSFNASVGFDIREFIEASISLRSSNSSFYRYLDASSGKFSVSELFSDLYRSLKFWDRSETGVGGTSFVADSISAAIVHKMSDWDLKFTYEGNVQLDGNEWKWKPKFTVLLQWKAIPELKVDKTINT